MSFGPSSAVLSDTVRVLNLSGLPVSDLAFDQVHSSIQVEGFTLTWQLKKVRATGIYSRSSQTTNVLRFVHPDGRMLTLVSWDMYTPLTDPYLAASHRPAAVAALPRLFEEAWALAAADTSYEAARDRLLTAVEGVNSDVLERWRIAYAQQPHQPGFDTMSPKTVTALHEAGWTPETCFAWWATPEGLGISGGKPQALERMLLFSRAGWTRAQYWAVIQASIPVGTISYKDVLPLAWLTVPADLAVLVHKAGMTPKEASRLAAAGQLDEDGLQTMIALRASGHPRTSRAA